MKFIQGLLLFFICHGATHGATHGFDNSTGEEMAMVERVTLVKLIDSPFPIPTELSAKSPVCNCGNQRDVCAVPDSDGLIPFCLPPAHHTHATELEVRDAVLCPPSLPRFERVPGFGAICFLEGPSKRAVATSMVFLTTLADEHESTTTLEPLYASPLSVSSSCRKSKPKFSVSNFFIQIQHSSMLLSTSTLAQAISTVDVAAVNSPLLPEYVSVTTLESVAVTTLEVTEITTVTVILDSTVTATAYVDAITNTTNCAAASRPLVITSLLANSSSSVPHTTTLTISTTSKPKNVHHGTSAPIKPTTTKQQSMTVTMCYDSDTNTLAPCPSLPGNNIAHPQVYTATAIPNAGALGDSEGPASFAIVFFTSYVAAFALAAWVRGGL